jgi:hypothetical protein
MEEVAAENLGRFPGTRQFEIRSRTNPAVSYWGTFRGYSFYAERRPYYGRAPYFYIKDNLPLYYPYMTFPRSDWTYHAEKEDAFTRREAAIKEHQRVHGLHSSAYYPLHRAMPPVEPKAAPLADAPIAVIPLGSVAAAAGAGSAAAGPIAVIPLGSAAGPTAGASRRNRKNRKTPNKTRRR